MSRNFLRVYDPLGLTLVEVIVSLALLTTLLVGALFAQDRHMRQIRTARQIVGVVQRVDQLVYRWVETDRAIPREANGTLPGNDDLIWNARSLNSEKDLVIDIIRVEVRRRNESTDERPLLTLDLAAPAAPPKEGT